MSENRFQPPASDVTEPEPAPRIEYEIAKRDQRAANFIIDALIAYPLMLLLIFLPDVLGIFVLLDIKTGLYNAPKLATWLITLFFYYLVCEGIWFRTIGKMITGTRVIQTSGNNPDFSQIIARSLIRFIPLEFVTYLVGGDRPAGWHDRWSNTKVIVDS